MAIEAGRCKSQILPIEVTANRKAAVFDIDEHPKPGTTAASLAGLKPAFKKDGVVTAGNASGINDGAAAVILASETYVKRNGVKPLARIVAYAHAGVEPNLMGIVPFQRCRPCSGLPASGSRISM